MRVGEISLVLLLLLVEANGFQGSCTAQRGSGWATRSPSGIALQASLGDFDKLTVVELKSLLRTRNLPVSGVKAELQERLASSLKQQGGGDDRVVEEDEAPSQPSHTTPSSLESFLDFDDSVFDEAASQSRGASKRVQRDGDERRGAVPKQQQQQQRWSRGEDGFVGDESSSSPSFTRGQQVQATIIKYGPLGATVRVDSIGQGLILQQDIVYWQASNGAEPRPGETIPAFVESVRKDGKINVSLRPVGYDKIESARRQLQELLEAQPGDHKVLNLGDKSTPDEIWAVLPGVSKGYFKHAVGYLLRLGAVVVEANQMTYVPEGKRVPMAAQPWSGKTPRGWKFPEGATLFAANLAFSTDALTLAEAVEKKIGLGKIAKVEVRKDPDSGKSRGFAYVCFFTPEQAAQALQTLGGARGLRVDGREVRLEMQAPLAERASKESSSGNGGETATAQGNSAAPVKREAPRDWGASSLYGIKGAAAASSASSSSSRRDSSEWHTVYAGDLPYKVTEDSLKFILEDALRSGGGGGSEGQEAVAAVRLAKDFATGKARGFGFIDFFDEATALRAVKELSGMTVMDRPIKLDYEGKKKKEKVEGEGGRTRAGGRTPGSGRGAGGGGGGGWKRDRPPSRRDA